MKKKAGLEVQDVVVIRGLLRQGVTQTEIAEQFGVNPVTIGDIARGTTWKHVQIDEQGNLIKDEIDAETKELIEHFKGLNKVDWNKENIEKIKLLHEKLNISFTKMEELIGVNRKQISAAVKGTINKPKVKKKRVVSVLKDKPIPTPELVKMEVEEKETFEKGEVVESFQIISENEKRKFLDGLWVARPYRLDGVISTKIECTNEKFNTWLHSHWSKKYRPYRRLHMEEFLAQATWIVQDTVLRNQSLDWKHIDANDESEIKKLYATLIQAVSIEQMKYSNELQGVKIRERKVKGQKFYEYISLGDESIDVLQSGADEEESYLSELLADDANLYAQNEDESDFNITNDFIRFFNEYKNYFLTEHQLYIYEVMRATNNNPSEREQYGVNKNQVYNAQKNINERAIAAYQEVHGKSLDNPFEITMAERQKNNEIKLWQKFIDIANDEDIETQNYRLSMYLFRWIDKNVVFNLIAGLYLPHSKEVNRAYKKMRAIDSSTLYYLYEQIEKRLEELKQLDYRKVKFYRKDEEYKIDGKVVSIDDYREQQKRIKKESQVRKGRKKHTSLRLLTTGSTFELNK